MAMTNKENAVSVPPYKNGTETESTSSFEPIVASKLQAAEFVWLVHGLIAHSSVALLSALWKAGKTTWLAHLLRCTKDGDEFCGRACSPIQVLVVSEENPSRWIKRRDKLGIGDNVYFLCRPFKGKPTIPDWQAFIASVRKWAEAKGISLVIFDTISSLWPVRDENDAAQVQAALMPLWHIADTCSVLIVHHLKKGDGQEGTGSRGSGALPSFVDTIMELRRLHPSDQQNRQRVLTSYGRDDATPPELVIELSPDGMEYVLHGSKQELGESSIHQALLGLLPDTPPGFSLKEIKDNWGDDSFPRKSKIMDVLKENTGTDWQREGSGKKGDPFTYYKIESQAQE